MRRATQRRAFRELARVDARDLWRDRPALASALTMAFVLLVLHTCMWAAFSVAGTAPLVETGPFSGAAQAHADGPEGGRAAEAQLAAFAPAGDERPNMRVAEHEGRLTITLLEKGVGWDPVWQAARAGGVPAGSIDVIGTDGEPAPDFLRSNLGTAILAAIASIALLATVLPIVAARNRGMLRLLGTTPLPRWLFLAAKIPARLALTVAVTAGIVTIALARNYAEPTALPRFAVTVLCGVVMLFGIAALCASRAHDPESAQGLMVTLSLGLVFSGGGVLPAEVLRGPARVVLGLLPGSWFTEPANADLAGLTPLLPVPAYWALMLVTGAVCFALASRRFSWDAAPACAAAAPRAPAPEPEPAPATRAPATPTSAPAAQPSPEPHAPAAARRERTPR